MTIEQALFRLHEGLPRNSPGSEKTTLTALRRFGRLPRGARAIDLGCGSGSSTIVLARRLKSEVVAIDAHEPFLGQLAERAKREGLESVVVPRHADFANLDEELGTFDVLWSEGAAYVLGFEVALQRWSSLLKRGGHAGITELSWLTDHASDEAKEYWSSVYPGMRTIVGNCAAAERAGYTVVDTITLSNKDWMAYYKPLKARIAELRSEGEPSPELAVVIEEAEREMAIYEQHEEEFGYVFYLLTNQNGADSADPFGEADEDGESESSDEDWTEEESPRSVRSSRLGGTERQSFDDAIAPADSAAHRATEARFAELVGELGLERATQLLEAIRARVAAAVQGRK